MSRAWDPDRWRAIEPLLDRALDREPEDRAEWLRAECGDDAELLRDVERAIREVEGADDVFDRGLALAAPELMRAAVAQTRQESITPGADVGPWRVLGRLGEGGMSTVWRVERTDGEFTQTAALKVIRGASADLVDRFLHERRTLARLEHPNIARLIDGGKTAEGSPWLVMELIDGQPVTDWCRARGPSLRERLDLLLEICEAVGHAHRRLIVHRDLKPSNILVTPSGAVKLLDFGIAKWLEAADDALITRTGFGFHTPQYASPEQLRGTEVTTATDVYSLGLILYEMLAGVRPYELSGLAATERLAAVCDVDVPPPSDRTERPERARPLRGDLDNIVQTALRKEPERRYSGVDALAEDIRRYLDGVPVRATPDTRRYRLGKFLRRNRGAVSAWGIAGLALLGGLAASAWQARVASSERDAARREAHKAELATDFLVATLGEVDPYEGDGVTMTAMDLVDRGIDRLDSELAEEPEMRSRLMTLLASVLRATERLYEAEELSVRAVELAEEVHGPGSVQAVRARHVLGLTLGDRGQWDESREQLERALADAVRALGEDHPEIGGILDDVAVARARDGDLNGAVEAAERAVAILRLHDPESQILSIALSHLATALQSAGDERTDAAYEEAVKHWEETQRELSPGLSSTVNNWAIHAHRQGAYAKAMELHRRAFELRVRAASPTDTAVATSRNNLANLLLTLGRVEEAELLLREGLRQLEEVDAGADVSVAAVHLNLGHALLEQGRVEESRVHYAKGRDRFAGSLGEEHRYTVFADALLARCMAAQGEAAAAERALASVAGELEAALPDAAAHLVRVSIWRGEVLRGLGRPEEGATSFRRALDLTEPVPDAPTLEMGQAHAGLGGCLADLGRRDEAARHLAEGARILEGIRGRDDPGAARARGLLADVD